MAVEICTVPGYGELRREDGYGQLKTFKPPERGKRNAQVEINAEHLSDPVSGWVDTLKERDVYASAAAAFDRGQRVFYTVYTCRKPDVADDIPFQKLDKNQKRRLVVELTPVNGEGIPLDQTDDGAISAPPPERDPEPQPQGEPPKAAADEEPPPPPEPEGGGQPAGRSARPGPRIAEAKPWEPLNSDGTLNLGSFAVQAAETMVLHAYQLMVAAGLEPVPSRVKSLARRLLNACDTVQARVRADHRADRMVASHARARAAVLTVLDRHPVPFGEGNNADVVAKWSDALVDEAAALLDVVVDLVDREVA